MLLLFQIHDLLYVFEFGLCDYRHFNDFEPNHVFGRTVYLAAVRLTPIDARILTGTRQIAFLVDYPPPCPDRVAQDNAHTAGRHTHHFRQLCVALISRKKLPKGLPYQLGLRFVVEPFALFVPNPEWKHNRALGQFSPPSLFLFGAPDALKNLSPFHSSHCRSNGPHKAAGLVVEINRSLGQIQDGLGVRESLEQGVISEILRTHQPTKLSSHNTIYIWGLHQPHQFLNLG